MSPLAQLLPQLVLVLGILAVIQIATFARMLLAIRATPVPRPQFTPYNEPDDWMPAERRAEVADQVAALAVEGFTVVMNVFWESARRRLIVMGNDATAEFAAVVSNTFSGQRVAISLSISCELADGREVSVDDSALGTGLPGLPQLTRWQLPMAHPPARLLRAFRYILARDFPGQRPTVRDQNLSIEERTRRSMIRETTHWIARGYYAIDPRTNTPFPTWGSALRMMIHAAFPFGSINRRRVRRHAQALLAEAESVPWEHHRVQHT